jgi:hypothetical protein
MQSGLGHRVVRYMVTNVFEEHSGSLHRQWEDRGSYVLTETSVPTNQITQSHNSEYCNFES